MLKKTIIILSLLIYSLSLFAQSTGSTIPYSNIPNVGCNVFGPGQSYNGFTHATVVGQPQNSLDGLIMPVNEYGVTRKKTGFRIDLNSTPGQTWSFEVFIAAEAITHQVRLSVYTASATPTASACSGAQELDISSMSNVTNVATFDITDAGSMRSFSFVATSTTKYLVLIAENSGPQSPSSLKLSYMNWNRTEPFNPGTYSITSSKSERPCMDTSPITFTFNRLTNPGNNTLTGYSVVPAAGQWQGGSAPITVSAANPTLTLYPLQCASNLQITASAIINGSAYLAGTKAVSTKIPTWPYSLITGPDTIKSVGSATASADYTLNLAGYSACSVPSWSFSAGDMNFIESVNNTANAPFTATVTKKMFIYGPNVTLKAAVLTCGVPVTFTQPIYLDWKQQGTFGLMGSHSSLATSTKLNIVPNPSTGIFHIDYGKAIESGYVEVRMADGRLIQKNEVVRTTAFDVDITKYPSGIYIIFINDGSQITTERIVKQ